MPVRRILFVLVAAAVLLGAGYAAYWFHVAGELRKGVEAWAAERRADGWQVEWAAMAIAGFPGPVRLHLTAPALTHPEGIAWRAGTLTASAQPMDLSRVSLAAPGRHQLEWGGQTGELDAVLLHGTLDFDGAGRVREVSLSGNKVTTQTAGAEVKADGLSFSVSPRAVAAPKHDTETVRFAAALYGVTLPAVANLVLEREVALAEVNGRVLGPIPDGPPAAALAGWASDGGTVEIDRLILDWAPMGLEADGTLALDPRGQPLAALAARVRGFSELMDRLSGAGTIDPSAAAAAKLVLSLMAKPDRNGRPAVPVAVSVQDGDVFLGSARVARLPPLRWPETPD